MNNQGFDATRELQLRTESGTATSIPELLQESGARQAQGAGVVQRVARRESSQAVQRKEVGSNSGPETIRQAAVHGIHGTGGTLPYLDTVQRSFGRHDVSGIQAHVGARAAEASAAMGANAYATGNSVAFRDTPDLHTVAHEAAHVIQQRGGVQLRGGVGQIGDRYEQHADRVADLVVQGKSAEDELSTLSPPGDASSTCTTNVQLEPDWSESLAIGADALGSAVGDIGRGVERGWEYLTTDEQGRQRMEEEYGRVGQTLIALLRKVHAKRALLADVIELVVRHYDSLPGQVQGAIEQGLANAGAHVAGRVLGGAVVARITEGITSRVAIRLGTGVVGRIATSVSTLVGTAVSVAMVNGLIERATAASRSLQAKDPVLHQQLVAHDAEMLWFLIAPEEPEILRAVAAARSLSEHLQDDAAGQGPSQGRQGPAQGQPHSTP